MNGKRLALLFACCFAVFGCEKATDYPTALIDQTVDPDDPIDETDGPIDDPDDPIDKTDDTDPLAVTSGKSGFMDKGTTRAFTVDTDKEVVWTVEGTSEGSKTAIDKAGKLTIGANEGNITLTVKATAADNPANSGTAAVKVRGWQEITQSIKEVFSNHTVAAYGTPDGAGRWVVGGENIYGVSARYLTSFAWSDNEGQTWTEVPQKDYKRGSGYSQPYLLAQESIHCITYDGPTHDKKYVAATSRCNVFWSRDGKIWTKERNVLHGDDYGESDMPNSLEHLVYGEPDGAPGGRYLVAKLYGGKFAYSSDATNWQITTEQQLPTNRTMSHLWFGHALIDGDPSRIFVINFFSDTDTTAPYDETHYNFYYYSKDGINWGKQLKQNEFEKLNFKPRLPAGGYFNAPLDMVSLPVRGYISDSLYGVDLTDLEFAPLSTDDTGGTYRKYVSFFARSNNKLFAFGNGARAAFSHVGAYD
jgi:hypothetical protein